MTHVIEIPFHIGDFLSGTMHMDGTEIGAYWMLCVAHYQAGEQGLPDDDKQLARIVRLPIRTWIKIRPTIEAKFTVSDGFWFNSKVVDVLQKIHARSTNAKANSLKRWDRGDATALPPQCNGNANHKPITINQRNKKEAPYSEKFLEAWKLYPRDRAQSKEAAWRAWQSVPHPEDLKLSLVKGYAADMAKPGAPFPCHMSTFFGRDKLYAEYLEASQAVEADKQAAQEILESLSGVQRTLCDAVTPEVYRAWLKDAKIRDGPTVEIMFPSDFRRQFFQDKYAIRAEAALGKKLICRTGT